MQGVWKPRKIANPDYFLDEAPLTNIGKIGGVAVEIWTMDEGYLFDNILVANDASAAQAKREALWVPKNAAEVGAPAHLDQGLLAVEQVHELFCSICHCLVSRVDC